MNKSLGNFDVGEVYLVASRTDMADSIVTLNVFKTRVDACKWIAERAEFWSSGYTEPTQCYEYVLKIETNINAQKEWVIWYILSLEFDETYTIAEIYNRLLAEDNHSSVKDTTE